MLKTDPAAISSAEFFDRSRARLRFDVPPGLVDPNIIPRSGDQGTDPNAQPAPPRKFMAAGFEAICKSRPAL